MSRVVIQGDSSGTGDFTIAAPNSNTDRTLTLPDEAGTVLTTATAGVPVNGPAFSASPSTQAYTTNTWTKVMLTSEEFDTNSCFDNTTNYRFTPTVAGYYQLNAYIDTSGATYVQIAIYKNGALYKTTQQASSAYGTTCSTIISMNGSTDYVELYGFMTTSSNITTLSNFSGAMVRSAV
jgi:hypothetical protein